MEKIVNDSNDPLAPYRAKGEIVKQQILKAVGNTYTHEEVCSLLKVSPDQLDRMYQRRLLLGLPVDGYRVYPAWQFVRTWAFRCRVRPGLDEVLNALTVESDWGTAIFLLDNLELLKAGQIKLLVFKAEHYMEQGGS